MNLKERGDRELAKRRTIEEGRGLTSQVDDVTGGHALSTPSKSGRCAVKTNETETECLR